MSDCTHRQRLPRLAASAVVVAAGVLVAACSGSSGTDRAADPVPPPGGSGQTGLANTDCALSYSVPTTATSPGADPLLSAQWHLNNDGSLTGRAGEDLKAFAAWNTTRGSGVRIAVIDDAIEVVHDDLRPNVVAGSYDYRSASRGGSYPLPCDNSDSHGTSVAGLIAARDDNALGGAGVAPKSSLVGLNALATSISADVSDALNRDLASNWIYNNSWGSADDGFLHPARPSFVEAINNGIATGRGGKGAIYVFPSGNGGCYNPDDPATVTVEPCVRENSNYDGFVNKIGIITACAVASDGTQPFYGERGANMLVCAPSSGAASSSYVRTTAIRNGYRNDFSGTSASTPMVSGVVGLMLAANPELTWRDVRLILARSARQNDASDTDWRSANGLRHSHKYGFGVADAAAAVALARTWTSVGGSTTLATCGPYNVAVNQPLLDPAGQTLRPVASTASAAGCGITRIEFVEVGFTAKSANYPASTAEHPSSGDLRIRLTSPAGLVSELADARVCYNSAAQSVNCGAYNDYVFGSVRHLEEPVVGAANANWTLEVADLAARDEGRFVSWWIKFHGR